MERLEMFSPGERLGTMTRWGLVRTFTVLEDGSIQVDEGLAPFEASPDAREEQDS